MIKKVVKNLSLFACIALMTACGGEKKTDKLENSSVEITAECVEGKTSEAIKIVDSSCKLNMTIDENRQKFTVKVKLAVNETLPGFENADIDDISLGWGPKLKVFDANGGELMEMDLGTDVLDSSTKDEFKKLLKATPGTEKEFTFSESYGNAERAAKVMAEAKSFKIVDADFSIDEPSSVSVVAVSSASEIEDELKANGWTVNNKGEIIDAAGKVIKTYQEAVSAYGEFYEGAMKDLGVDVASVAKLYGKTAGAAVDAAIKMAEMDVDDIEDQLDAAADALENFNW